jgi:hypothetical protein
MPANAVVAYELIDTFLQNAFDRARHIKKDNKKSAACSRFEK